MKFLSCVAPGGEIRCNGNGAMELFGSATREHRSQPRRASDPLTGHGLRTCRSTHYAGPLSGIGRYLSAIDICEREVGADSRTSIGLE